MKAYMIVKASSEIKIHDRFNVARDVYPGCTFNQADGVDDEIIARFDTFAAAKAALKQGEYEPDVHIFTGRKLARVTEYAAMECELYEDEDLGDTIENANYDPAEWPDTVYQYIADNSRED